MDRSIAFMPDNTHRMVVAMFPDRFSPEPIVRVLTEQVSTSVAGATLYDAVDYFERTLFKRMTGISRRVEGRVPLRGIISLHNFDGLRDMPQIAGMINQILAGSEILHVSGVPNVKVVMTRDKETVLFDGHHTLMAYLATGHNYLNEVPHLVVHNRKHHVKNQEILVFFGIHSRKVKPACWRDYVINWQAPSDSQLCGRIQGNVGELFDLLYSQITMLNTQPTMAMDFTFNA